MSNDVSVTLFTSVIAGVEYVAEEEMEVYGVPPKVPDAVAVLVFVPVTERTGPTTQVAI